MYSRKRFIKLLLAPTTDMDTQINWLAIDDPKWAQILKEMDASPNNRTKWGTWADMAQEEIESLLDSM